MDRVISHQDMANVRQSLAQAGIFFDKLYINQVINFSFWRINFPLKLCSFRLISIVILLFKLRMINQKNRIVIFYINYYADQVSCLFFSFSNFTMDSVWI